MRTPEAREVLLEVYINGALHSAYGCFALDDKDVQLEFEIADAIYDLIGCSASQDVDVKLQVVTNDKVSISYCSPGEMRLQLEVNENDGSSVCDVNDLLLEMNGNDGISELKNPTLVIYAEDLREPEALVQVEKNRPTENTARRMFKKIKAFSQRIRAFPQRKTPKSVGQPEVDLLDPEESCVPDPRAPEPEPEMDLVNTEQFCIPEMDLVAPPETDLIAPPEPKLDMVDPKESYVSPKESTKVMKIKKVHGFVMTKKAEYVAVRNIKKISIAAWPEMDLSVPKPEPKWDLVDSVELYTPGLGVPEPEEDLVAPSEPKWDLVDAVELYSLGSNVPEPDPELERDLVNSVELYAPGPSVPEPNPEEDLDDPPEREWDVVDSVELYAPGSSFPEPEPEEDLVDSVELNVPGPSVPKPQPEWYLAALDDPSIPEPVSRLENYIPLNMFQLEDRLKKCTLLKERHVSNVWPRVFIGDEEIATDRDALKEMCITHILNAAAQKKDLKYYLGTFNDEDIVGSVNTRSRYYRGLHINYYGLPTADRCCSDISEYFMPAAKFIDKALDKRASKVLICCKQGVEHSATLFLAYLMICHDMMVEEAVDHVMKSRCIRPSRDVLKKLMLLNADLVQQRKLKLQGIKTGRNRKKWQLKKN
ncbi:uncharacterized protein LOC131522691 [Onychostoma macrolepis]|uniref:Uncharacterized protein n=1 Tax=Onychostoma macrolepis TaxID=369639 RepID=A0A7J6C3F6_9TELE|nr:uncharacterized protein LOC131522691 [Onychostoma macrolepis]KAF4101817.1 hypothetical protein G5714_016617 [Onychostoma macrolepis]